MLQTMDRLTTIAAVAFATLLLPATAAAGPDCLCRADGRFFKQGDLACIRTATGLKLAKCEMSQNVTTWNLVGDSCPQAGLAPALSGQADIAEVFLKLPTAPLSKVSATISTLDH